MKKPKINLQVLGLLAPSILAILLVIAYYAFNAGEREVSEELLHAFYTFDLNTIADNDKRISELTTKEIYESHTISSSTRQLRVYLKFQGNPTEAKIISHKDNIIYYSILSEGFDPERIFALGYDYSWGKINKIVEYEVFLLPQSLRSDLK